MDNETRFWCLLEQAVCKGKARVMLHLLQRTHRNVIWDLELLFTQPFELTKQQVKRFMNRDPYPVCLNKLYSDIICGLETTSAIETLGDIVCLCNIRSTEAYEEMTGTPFQRMLSNATHVEVVQFWLNCLPDDAARKAALGQTDKRRGNTAFHDICQIYRNPERFTARAKLMIKYGANLCAVNHDGMIPADYLEVGPIRDIYLKFFALLVFCALPKIPTCITRKIGEFM